MQQLRKLRFVATEKVHGANFAIRIVDCGGPAQLHFAKRTAILGDDDDFYGCRSSGLTRRLSGPALAAFASYRAAAPPAGLAAGASFTIYGELFGGHYPHDDVAQVNTLRPVQSGISYSPELQFMAFDVAIEEAIGGPRRYLDFDELRPLLEPHGFMVAAALASGSFEGVMAFEVGFDSTIPARLGLPSLAAGTNAAEGVVIRSSSSLKDGTRWCSKNKIEAFSEAQYTDQTLSRAHREAIRKRNAMNAASAADEDSTLEFEAMAMVTPQRLANVLSKIGRLRRHMCKEVLGAFYDDILAEMKEEFGKPFAPKKDAEENIRHACKTLILAALKEEERAARTGDAVV